MLKVTKVASVMLMTGLISACTTSGEISTPLQLTATEAVRVFEEDRASFGQQIAFAEGGYTTRVHDLAPSRGR